MRGALEEDKYQEKTLEELYEYNNMFKYYTKLDAEFQRRNGSRYNSSYSSKTTALSEAIREKQAANNNNSGNSSGTNSGGSGKQGNTTSSNSSSSSSSKQGNTTSSNSSSSSSGKQGNTTSSNSSSSSSGKQGNTTVTTNFPKKNAGGTATTTIDTDTYEPTELNARDYKRAFDMTSTIVGSITIVGIVISITMVMVLGIKYMIGSVEEKAEYKKTMVPMLIGAILLFTSSTMVSIIYQLVQEL